jgi:serine/threonine protein kinase
VSADFLFVFCYCYTLAASFQGSPLYQAPEIIREQKYSQKGDVYSFGVCLLEMCTGKKPFHEYKDLNNWDFIGMRRRGTKPGDIPSDSPFAEILERCLKNDYTQRPTFAELLQMLEVIKPKQ